MVLEFSNNNNKKKMFWNRYILSYFFPTQKNNKHPIDMSLVPDLVTWKKDAFQHLWDNLEAYTLPKVLLFVMYLVC